MNVDVKWLGLDSDAAFQNALIESLQNIKHKECIDNINAIICRRSNSRHIIDLKIKTVNPDEFIYASGNSFSLDYSLKDLKANLKKAMKEYDPHLYAHKKALEAQWEKEREINRKLKEERIAKELLTKEEMKKRREKQQEEEKLAKAEKRNAEILKRLEKKRKKEEELEKKVIAELEQEKKLADEQLKLEQEKQEKAQEEIHKVGDEIDKALQEDEKIQTEIKESKDKLRDLWAEENECLVIIDQIKEWNEKIFSNRPYKINEPFELVPGRPLYHDGHDNYFIVGESGDWEPFYDIEQEFEAFKAQKIQQLEQRLIAARAKRKHHITELVDEGEIIEKLKESKQILKQKEIEQKKELQQLQKDQKLISELTNNEMKLKASDALDEIDVIETHPANETFEAHPGIFAYHDGEGNYFYQQAGTSEWIPTTKSYIYADNDILNLKLVEDHPANETFQNSKGIYFYHDGAGHYFKNEEDKWVPSTYEECYPKKAKLIKKRQKQNDLDTNASYVDVVKDANKRIEEKKIEKLNEQFGGALSGDAQSDDGAQATTGANEPRQWQDEATGVWWYLDAQGNYFYADENGNWIPHQGT